MAGLSAVSRWTCAGPASGPTRPTGYPRSVISRPRASLTWLLPRGCLSMSTREESKGFRRRPPGRGGRRCAPGPQVFREACAWIPSPGPGLGGGPYSWIWDCRARARSLPPLPGQRAFRDKKAGPAAPRQPSGPVGSPGRSGPTQPRTGPSPGTPQNCTMRAASRVFSKSSSV